MARRQAPKKTKAKPIPAHLLARMEQVRSQNTERHKANVDSLALRNRIIRSQVVQQAKAEHDRLLMAQTQGPLQRHALDRMADLKQVIGPGSWRTKPPPPR